MNYSIRVNKTSSGKQEVQVVHFHKRKTIVDKYFGSGNTEEDLIHLKTDAKNWIQEQVSNFGLFQKQSVNIHIPWDSIEYLGFKYYYAYEFLKKLVEKFNFHTHIPTQFTDLLIASILEPNSKRSSLEFLEEFMDKVHSLDYVYKLLGEFVPEYKSKLEKEVIRIAKEEFKFDFSFVLYDVTTLYFESFKPDELRKPGFSKDGKSVQPQIVVGLMVTDEGFPLSYDIWEGNTSEGYTFLPTLKNFKKLHDVKKLTVIADSAMAAKVNKDELVQEGFDYIIGASLGKLKGKELAVVLEKMQSTHGYSIRLDNLIVDFSNARKAKDLQDIQKQVDRAAKYVGKGSYKSPKLKFLKSSKAENILNQNLIEKHKKLAGLKAYTTNLEDTVSKEEIIQHYHTLFRVEHAWRIAKSDLESRPIYHHKADSIKNHILICYLALTISVYLELKTGLSILQITKQLKSITDAKLRNISTGEIVYKRSIKNISFKI